MAVIISKTLTNGKALDFSAGFLRAHPNNEVDGNGDPVYTDLEWITKCIFDYGKREYEHGKKLLANDEAVVDNDIYG